MPWYSDKVVVETRDYQEATAEMVQHNQALQVAQCGDNGVITELKKEGSKLKACKEYGFHGNLDESLATALYCTLVKYYDSASGQVVLKKGEGEKLITFPGFHKYAPHLGVHDEAADVAQRSSSTIINSNFMQKKAKTEWPQLFAVFEKVKELVGKNFHFITSHVLYSKNQVVCFEYHQDTNDHIKTSDLSVIVNLSKSKSSFKIAGADELPFERAGELYAFHADFWHRSGEACEDTIKIAFFFKFEVAQDVEGSSQEPAVSDVVKTEVSEDSKLSVEPLSKVAKTA